MFEKKHETEEKLPIQTTAFKELIDKMYAVHLDKNRDYSPANILIAGDIGVLIRVWDKFCRLCNLYGVEFPAPKPLIDNLIEKLKANKDNDIITPVADVLSDLEKIRSKSEFDWGNIKKKSPSNESIKDSWMDMSVYSIIGLLEDENKWGR